LLVDVVDGAAEVEGGEREGEIGEGYFAHEVDGVFVWVVVVYSSKVSKSQITQINSKTKGKVKSIKSNKSKQVKKVQK
jgi:hypothetical protein